MSGFRFSSSRVAAFALGAVAATLSSEGAIADSQPYVGEVMIVPYTYCPVNFLEANGALLPIGDYDVLFNLYGTTFGGDGQTTFALPDLRGRLPIHAGTGPGLSNYILGQSGGAESVFLTTTNLPFHSHSVQATNSTSDKTGPGGKFLALASSGVSVYHEGPANKVMDPAMLGMVGSNLPVSVQDPYLTMRICVSVFGLFPSQN
ncbi:MAG: tail fiber protein [Pseudomonadota bacterium]